ncbi:GNAT family N-acetyltransferase [Paenibacillus sp. FSL H8-0548]|uniref:GNAT family N-acetyltransferase n=1 Tax=Paenibacillus sp. FSL H8-0548 TaxID=1920422 RepID=UPI00096C4AB4|nr:GNAT family N-acetyltransferase [Paenibacillus sp. FSL H8-0548]OMF29808.1 GNAT family N-acetyltransferase [Paenibacillus sp. FSL H8-0548]
MSVLTTERLILRQLEEGDADELERLINDYDVARTTLNIPYPYPKGGALSFIRHRAEVLRDGAGYSFGIINKETNGFMGTIGMQLDNHNNRAELGYWLGKPFWNQGFVTEGVKRITAFGFDELKLHKIHAAAMTKNPASSSVMKKAGMKYEGTLRQHYLKWDAYEDIDYYGILREEYLKLS